HQPLVIRPRARHGRCPRDADLHGVDAQDRHLDHLADRIRPIHVEAGSNRADITPEDEVEADFLRLNGVEPGGEPSEHAEQNEEEDRLAAEALSAAEPAPEPCLQATQHVLEIGRVTPAIAAGRALPPGPLPLRAPRPASPTLIAPRHIQSLPQPRERRSSAMASPAPPCVSSSARHLRRQGHDAKAMTPSPFRLTLAY